jgi:hypothetical protein
MALHQAQDKQGTDAALELKRQARMEDLRKEAARTREFLASHAPRTNRKGQELKTNVTDPDSAKMATSKGVIQGYAAQAAVDSAHQVIVAADVIGSGSEQAMLIPMIEQSNPVRDDNTLITADAGYHSDANVQHLKDNNIPALIADNQMRKRDERFAEQAKHKDKPDPLYNKTVSGDVKPVKRFRPKDFRFNDDNTATCPAGQSMTSPGTIYATTTGLHYQRYTAKAEASNVCPPSGKCLRGPIAPNDGRGRQISGFVRDLQHPVTPGDRMRHAIDSVRGRRLYSQRMGTVEPVFANIRHNKRLTRLNHRGRDKVNTQWTLYCLVHNIEKLAKTDLGRRLN